MMRAVPEPRAPSPLLPVRHFRVFVGEREVAVAQVRGLAWGDQAEGAPRPVLALRRALGADQELFRWRERAAKRDEPRDVHIDLYDAPGGRAVSTWAVVGARPAKWSGPELDALADDVAIEELELTYDSIEWLKEPGGRRPKTTT